MNEAIEKNTALENLKQQRDSLRAQIESLEAQLEILEAAISDLADIEEGKIPKDRIVELLKKWLADNPGKTHKEIREYVRGHGGISHRNLDKRLRTSLTRSVNVGTLKLVEDRYYLTEHE